MGADTAECSMHCLNLIVGVLLFLITLPTLGVSIASYVIASENWDETCAGGFMRAQTWLVVNSTISLAYVIGGLVMCYLYYKLNKVDFFGYLMVGTVIIVPIKLIWNIIGAVVLFKNSSSCAEEADSLWSMALAVLVIQWVIMGISILFCGCCCLSRKNQSKQTPLVS